MSQIETASIVTNSRILIVNLNVFRADVFAAKDISHCPSEHRKSGANMQINFDLFTMLFVGNVSYLLLTVSMLMTRMLMLRIVAIGSGISGGIYDYFWLNDPVGTFWEAAFTSVNLAQIMRIVYENVSVRLNHEERDFHTQFLSSLAPYQVRRVLRTGLWLNAEAGVPITRQGEIISHLIFLKSGKCDVLVDDISVGQCNAGSMIGEISFRSGEGATATVLAAEPVRYLALERNGLQKLVKADPEISHAIEDVSTHSLEYKLARMNRTAQQIRAT